MGQASFHSCKVFKTIGVTGTVRSPDSDFGLPIAPYRSARCRTYRLSQIFQSKANRRRGRISWRATLMQRWRASPSRSPDFQNGTTPSWLVPVIFDGGVSDSRPREPSLLQELVTPLNQTAVLGRGDTYFVSQGLSKYTLDWRTGSTAFATKRRIESFSRLAFLWMRRVVTIGPRGFSALLGQIRGPRRQAVLAPKLYGARLCPELVQAAQRL